MTTTQKKRFIVTATVLTVALALLLLGALKYSFLAPAMYADNTSLSQEENDQIKALMLDAVASKYTLFATTDAEALYTAEAMSDPVFPWPADESTNGKGLVCLVNRDFMTTIKKTDSGDYQGIVTVNRLTETHYWHFTVSVVDGQYLINSLGLDI